MYRTGSTLILTAVALAVIIGSVACISSATEVSGDPDRLTREQIASVNVSTLYEAVQRLRPRWLEVRAQRTFELETQVLVVLDRTVLGGVDELRNLGVEIAAGMQYLTGSAAHGEFALPGDRHVEGVIVVHTRERE